MFEQPYDAVTWLGEKSKNPHLYRLLRGGLVFRHQESPLFQACVALSEMLRDEPDVVRRLIHHHDWRIYLIGNVVAVINKDSRFERDYVDKLIGEGNIRHFPAPVVAGWMIVNTGETVADLASYLRKMSLSPDKSNPSIPYGNVLSVYTALRILEREEAQLFEKTALFDLIVKSSYYPHEMEVTEHTYSAYLTYHPVTS